MATKYFTLILIILLNEGTLLLSDCKSDIAIETL